MLQVLSKNRILITAYLLILISSLILLGLLGKRETHLLFTHYHSAFVDGLMRLLTCFGDGIFMVITGVFLLFRRIRFGLVILSSFLVSSLLVQLLKRFIFADCQRPVAWFHEMGIEIYRIGGVEYHSAFSFPSGHTTTAFALFFGLAFLVNNYRLKILFLILAVITGFSRIYLSQHFLGDALAGSIIGIFTVLVMHVLFEKQHSEWLDKSIISLIRKKNV